jgi:hypothetical protein
MPPMIRDRAADRPAVPKFKTDEEVSSPHRHDRRREVGDREHAQQGDEEEGQPAMNEAFAAAGVLLLLDDLDARLRQCRRPEQAFHFRVTSRRTTPQIAAASRASRRRGCG